MSSTRLARSRIASPARSEVMPPRTGNLGRHLDRLRRLPASAVDAGAVGIFLLAVALDRLRAPVGGGVGITVVAAALTLTIAGALFARRTYPLSAFVVGSAALVTEALLGVASGVSPYANLVGIYSLGLYATKTRARFGPPLALVAVGLYFVGSAPSDGAEPAGVLFSWIATWAVGYSNARRREEQERARRAVRQQAVAEEQVRVARELHDVVGHTVNLMVVQAGAARLVLDSDPATARELLAGMERTGRESLADLDHVLGELRHDSDSHGAAATAVQPGLEQVPQLVNRLAGSGLDVALTLERGILLPPAADEAAYRIVQEALTNVLKHAAPCAATVDIHRDGDGVVVEVADDGPGLRDVHVPGRGLTGIAERVSMCGGTLEQTSGQGGGFVLRAVLPLP